VNVKRDVAEQLQLMALTVQARMRETLDYAGDHCSPEEFKRTGMVAGRVISALIDGILEPVQAEHADLIPKGMKGPYVVDLAKLRVPVYQRDPASIEADNRDDADLTPEQLHAVGALSTTEIDAIDAALMAEVTDRWQKIARIVARAMDALGDGRRAGVPDVYFAERVRELERRGLIESVGNTRRMRFSEVRRRGGA
jgi:hypothetical protein